jgi:hypothetical protein
MPYSCCLMLTPESPELPRQMTQLGLWLEVLHKAGAGPCLSLVLCYNALEAGPRSTLIEELQTMPGVGPLLFDMISQTHDGPGREGAPHPSLPNDQVPQPFAEW